MCLIWASIIVRVQYVLICIPQADITLLPFFSREKGYYCDVHLTHDSASGERYDERILSNERRKLKSHHDDPFSSFHSVRKAHNTGRNHLQNVRDYYQSLDPSQNEAIFAGVLHQYDLRKLPHPQFVYNPPNTGGGGHRGGFGGGRGGGRGGVYPFGDIF